HTQGGRGLIEIGSGDDALTLQLDRAIVVDLRLAELRGRQIYARLRRVQLGEELIDGLLSAPKLRLRLVDAHLIIARIENEQRLAAEHAPVLLDEEARDGARNPRGDQRDG